MPKSTRDYHFGKCKIDSILYDMVIDSGMH